MGEPLTLALGAGESPLAPALSEPWVTPDELSMSGISDSVDLHSACVVATEILYLLSGRQFGVRTETVRPRAGLASCGWGRLGSTVWTRMGAVPAFEDPARFILLKSPVRSVLSVKLNGAELMAGVDYFLYDNRRLERVEGLWPVYQRLDLDDTHEGTFSVYYQWGSDVPAGAKAAATAFATQLAKYLNRDSDCALPDRTISVTRQGVTQTMIDPNQFVKEARTGLYLVDTWLGAVNPNGNRRRPTITSPDTIDLHRFT